MGEIYSGGDRAPPPPTPNIVDNDVTLTTQYPRPSLLHFTYTVLQATLVGGMAYRHKATHILRRTDSTNSYLNSCLHFPV